MGNGGIEAPVQDAENVVPAIASAGGPPQPYRSYLYGHPQKKVHAVSKVLKS